MNQKLSEDQSWVLDSLVGFLKSPLWSTSLNEFIDCNSIVFDPDEIEDSEGKLVYRKEYEEIFQKYQALVDCLIESHMTELGIDERQFAKACEMAEEMLASKLKRILFEELWAAENYEVFLRLMVKRNVELQLEALELLVRKYGLIYDVFVPTGTSPKNFLSEEHIMREAIIRSLNDMALDKKDDEEKEENSLFTFHKLKSNVNTTNAKESIDSKNIVDKEPEEDNEDIEMNKEMVQQDAARLVETKQKIDRKMEEALHSAIMINRKESNSDQQLNRENHNNTVTDFLIHKKNVEPANQSTHQQKTASSEDIDKRANYLRTQRDKILKQRQKERTERISKFLVKEKNNSIKMEQFSQLSAEPKHESNQNEDNGEKNLLAFRKTLAARLKSEVILERNKQ